MAVICLTVACKNSTKNPVENETTTETSGITESEPFFLGFNWGMPKKDVNDHLDFLVNTERLSRKGGHHVYSCDCLDPEMMSYEFIVIPQYYKDKLCGLELEGMGTKSVDKVYFSLEREFNQAGFCTTENTKVYDEFMIDFYYKYFKFSRGRKMDFSESLYSLKREGSSLFIYSLKKNPSLSVPVIVFMSQYGLTHFYNKHFDKQIKKFNERQMKNNS